jgi:hypothetical protein
LAGRLPSRREEILGRDGAHRSKNKMPDVDLAIRHPALQSMCSKD